MNNDPRRFEIRRPNQFENLLGFPPVSQGNSALIVAYRDAKSNILVQQDYEFDDVTAPKRDARCTILWGAKGTQRAVVQLANGNCLFFPEPREDDDGCLSESVVKAYLTGEKIDGIHKPLRDTGGECRESSQPK